MTQRPERENCSATSEMASEYRTSAKIVSEPMKLLD